MYEGRFVSVRHQDDMYEIVFGGRHIVAWFHSEQMADALAKFFDSATEGGLPAEQNERLIIAASYLIFRVLKAAGDTKSQELALLRDNERVWREKYL